MKRKIMTLAQIRDDVREYQPWIEDVDELGICALVDVEDMGFCKDDITRWYHFTNANGEPCVYYKHGALF